MLILQTEFEINGQTKAAVSFNATVQSKAIRVFRLEKFVEHQGLLGWEAEKGPIPSLVLAVLTWEILKHDSAEYICMYATDLHGCDIYLISKRRSSMKKEFPQSSVKSVVCVLKPQLVRIGSAVYLEAAEENVLILGLASNVGTCQYVDIICGSCSNTINVRKSIYCQEHAIKVMSNTNPVGLRMYEEMASIKSMMHSSLSPKNLSSGLTLENILNNIATLQGSKGVLNERSDNKKCAPSAVRKKPPNTSLTKIPSFLRMNLRDKKANELTKAFLCNLCQNVSITPPQNCVNNGHQLTTIHVKLYSYKCSTCSRIYKTIRQCGPSFSCTTCFTNLWVTVCQDTNR